jgi:transglutaminase-like putative cysteine protease
LHLIAVRLPVYAGLSVLAIGPIAPGAGLAAALVGVALGLFAGRALAASPLRAPVIGGMALLVVGLGLVAERFVAGPPWISGLLGYRLALAAGEALMFGLIALGLVAGGRALAARAPIYGAIEAALVAAMVVATFAGHRESQFGRPQFLSDWALSQGYDPVQVLVGIGLSGGLACALLLLRPQHPGRTAAAVLTLVGLVLLMLFLLWRFLPEYHPPADSPSSEADPSIPPRPKPQDRPTPSPDAPPAPQPSPIAIVNLLDDLSGIAPRLYFRHRSLARLEGVHLTEAAAPADADVPSAFPTAKTEYPGASIDEGLFTPVSQRISLLIDLPRPIGLVGPRAIEPEPVGDPKLFRRTYHVASRVLNVPLSQLADRRAGDPSWPAAVRDQYLAVPADPRYKALAERVVATVIDDARLKPVYRGSPALRALALLQWINKETTYSKYPDAAPDPTAAFVFDHKPGKCTEVAHALVFMLRSLGIPARAAAGYAAPASRLGTGSYLLLQDTDAHQWCEVYFQGVGWVVVDTSPGRSITPPDVEPDSVTQTYYGEKNREPEAAVVDRMKDEQRAEAGWVLLPARACGSLLLLLVLAPYAVKFWRRLAPHWANEHALDRVAYRAVLDRLAELGLTRQFGETRAEFAERVARVAPEFVVLTAAYERRVLTGEGSLGRDEWVTLGARVGTRFPRPRHVRAFLDPSGWLRAR